MGKIKIHTPVLIEYVQGVPPTSQQPPRTESFTIITSVKGKAYQMLAKYLLNGNLIKSDYNNTELLGPCGSIVFKNHVMNKNKRKDRNMTWLIVKTLSNYNMVVEHNNISPRPSDVSASVTKSEKKSLALKLSGTLNRNNSGQYTEKQNAYFHT